MSAVRAWRVCVWLWLLLGVAVCPAWAHFPAGYDLRAIHFLRDGDGLHAYIRVTFPLAVANGMGPAGADGLRAAAPFTQLYSQGGHAVYLIDADRIRAAPLELAERVAQGHELRSAGEVRRAAVRSIRVYPRGVVPPFNNLEQVRAATAPGEVYPRDVGDIDASYAVVDLHLVYAGVGEEFSLRSSLTNEVIGQAEIQNIFVDHRADGRRVYRFSGPLHSAVLINPSFLGALMSFIRHGAEHVLGGADHLLFILCLALGASGLVALAWRVTGFTVGHTVSLVLGFWGYVPKGAWFVPAVETTIALSILIAGLSLLSERLRPRVMLPIIILVGFVHGLGFSFGLKQILDADGPQVWTGLAGFNLGVEIGQIGVAALVFMATAFLGRHLPATRPLVYRTIALACVAVSLYWSYERASGLFT